MQQIEIEGQINQTNHLIIWKVHHCDFHNVSLESDKLLIRRQRNIGSSNAYF